MKVTMNKDTAPTENVHHFTHAVLQALQRRGPLTIEELLEELPDGHGTARLYVGGLRATVGPACKRALLNLMRDHYGTGPTGDRYLIRPAKVAVTADRRLALLASQPRHLYDAREDTSAIGS
jgi:hypothetical protein